MDNEILSIHAHFDGRVIVPDEPVDLPVNTELDIAIRPRLPSIPADEATIQRRLEAFDRFVARGVHGASISDESLLRENLYGDDGR